MSAWKDSRNKIDEWSSRQSIFQRENALSCQKTRTHSQGHDYKHIAHRKISDCLKAIETEPICTKTRLGTPNFSLNFSKCNTVVNLEKERVKCDPSKLTEFTRTAKKVPKPTYLSAIEPLGTRLNLDRSINKELHPDPTNKTKMQADILWSRTSLNTPQSKSCLLELQPMNRSERKKSKVTEQAQFSPFIVWPNSPLFRNYNFDELKEMFKIQTPKKKVGQEEILTNDDTERPSTPPLLNKISSREIKRGSFKYLDKKVKHSRDLDSLSFDADLSRTTLNVITPRPYLPASKQKLSPIFKRGLFNRSRKKKDKAIMTTEALENHIKVPASDTPVDKKKSRKAKTQKEVVEEKKPILLDKATNTVEPMIDEINAATRMKKRSKKSKKLKTMGLEKSDELVTGRIK